MAEQDGAMVRDPSGELAKTSICSLFDGQYARNRGRWLSSEIY